MLTSGSAKHKFCLRLEKVFAALPQVESWRSVKLSGDPTGNTFLYCNGKSVYIRNLQNPLRVDIYTEHSKSTTVARYSPSGLLIASADVSGKVRVWEARTSEHKLKAEFQALSSMINDVGWSPDSQCVLVCGNGQDSSANIFSIDDGAPIGTVDGHIKIINTCCYRPVHPFCIVTGSEDNNVIFHYGPNFRSRKIQQGQVHQNLLFQGSLYACTCRPLKSTIFGGKPHNNYVHVVKYSRSGEILLTGGADGKLCLSPDDKQVLTASADKTAKVFNLLSGDLVQEFATGSVDWRDRQLGCLWQGVELITVNAVGHIIYHSLNTPKHPKKIIKGHMKPIRALAVSCDGSTIFTGGPEGILWWDAATGTNDMVTGLGHAGEVTDMVINEDFLISVGKDCCMRFASVSARSFSDEEVKLDSQPKAVDSKNGIIAAISAWNLTVMGTGLSRPADTLLKSEALCVSVHPAGSRHVAVGHKDNRMRIYSIRHGTAVESRAIEMHHEVNVVSYSPDATYLAMSCGRRVSALSATDFKAESMTVRMHHEASVASYSPDAAYLALGCGQWVSALSATDYKELSKAELHQKQVYSIAWSPKSDCFVSAGLDGNIILWDDVNDSYKIRPSVKAYPKSHASKVAWLDSSTLVTAGEDTNVRLFTVSKLP